VIRYIIDFVKLLSLQKNLIVVLAKREVENKYVGSLLGFAWNIIHPLVLIFVFWVVFSVGFKVKPANDVPFVVWLTAGLAAWLVFAEIINTSVSSVVNNAHLVKKTIFQSQILPVVKIIACSLTHLVFIILLIGLILFQNLPFSYYYFQILYYFFALIILSLGISWIVSALNVFIRDVGQAVNVVLQIGMWATPILWDINIMPPKIQMALKLNPMFYIVNGYRDSFIYFTPFWDHPAQTIYFWTVNVFLLFFGAFIFSKLKPYFADVL
jgi:homopolymeric O-antigen transport system permease protein